MLQGCGGSGGSNGSAAYSPNYAPLNPAYVPLTPLGPEPISTHGVISALGSIRVNGVIYDTANATVTVNGHSGVVSDLRLGHIVTLAGEINADGSTGTATTIHQNASIIGPVDSIDSAGSRLVVMGQMVLVDQTTLFDASIDPDSFDGLQVGTPVQISGFAQATGEIRATLIEPAAPATMHQIAGIVSALDQVNGLFKINRLMVNYDDAQSIQLPALLQDGSFVMVKGSLDNGILVGNQISSAFDAVLPGTAGLRLLIQGAIGKLASASFFQLNGRSIGINADTLFFNGFLDDLVSGSHVLVDAMIAADGNSILAHAITLRDFNKETTVVDFEFDDFTEISVSSVFKVHIIQDTQYSVQVTIDADVADNLLLTQTGTRLDLDLAVANNNVQTIDAVITMPVLDRVDLSGVTHVTLSEFNQQELEVDVIGVSFLKGESLSIGSLVVNVSGISQLDFSDISPLADTEINLSGMSSAILNMDVNSSLRGNLRGTSTLLYYGTGVNADLTTAPMAILNRLGDTRL
jgi:hypothetical protein|tara:strand:+ start:2270 stop:3832 length:1563 start_codon:yes stop_codon:yes gene_type:complete